LELAANLELPQISLHKRYAKVLLVFQEQRHICKKSNSSVKAVTGKHWNSNNTTNIAIG
jgi:hypothetical protein